MISRVPSKPNQSVVILGDIWTESPFVPEPGILQTAGLRADTHPSSCSSLCPHPGQLEQSAAQPAFCS